MGAPETVFSIPFETAAAAVAFGFGAALLIKICIQIFMRPKPTRFAICENLAPPAAEVVSWQGGEGYIRVAGELWRATSKEDLSPGDEVKLAARLNGLCVKISKR